MTTIVEPVFTKLTESSTVLEKQALAQQVKDAARSETLAGLPGGIDLKAAQDPLQQLPPLPANASTAQHLERERVTKDANHHAQVLAKYKTAIFKSLPESEQEKFRLFNTLAPSGADLGLSHTCKISPLWSFSVVSLAKVLKICRGKHYAVYNSTLHTSDQSTRK